MKILIILGLSLNPMLAFATGPGEGSGDTPPVIPEVVVLCSAAVKSAGTAETQRIQTINSAKTAGTWCRSETNPSIHKGILIVGGLLAGMQMMKSMQDSCSKFNDAMKAGQLALTAYTTSCTIVQSQCDSATSTYIANLAKVDADIVTGIEADKAAGKPSTCATAASDKASVEAARAAAQAIQTKCSGYKTSMMVAGAGIMSMLQQSGLMGKCEKAVAAVDCSKDPTNKECPQAMDCSNAANAGNAVCICKVNPSAPGCGGATANNNNNAPVGNAGRPTVSDLSTGDIGNYAPTSGTDGLISPTGGSAAGGSSLGGGSGGGGGGGGLGGGSGSAKEKDAAKKAGLNANILGGYEGGGGGGGSRGSGGSSNSGLKDFMPGGARDPNRNIAAQGLANREVTASGSKSNWEKVSDRYRDNQRSLMGP